MSVEDRASTPLALEPATDGGPGGNVVSFDNGGVRGGVDMLARYACRRGGGSDLDMGWPPLWER